MVFKNGHCTKPRAKPAEHGSGADGSVEIDWAADFAFRFFPVERDPLLGWRLHQFDAATNTALTLADARPDIPLGVAFVDAVGQPGAINQPRTLVTFRKLLAGGVSWAAATSP